ncbi:hypothetical protein [Methylobacterium organophilum]|uniref:Halobacterial output domain-containing protein n=1 Tax=Methylobacterium organophilum TaxID=410 RepID=A0ABQ4TCS0_METOR|nr:hypothetical protein [Methylobacterium organophilum]UMY18300.1 hypothetical protein MMB17_02820 [Methylobacterium organophilum]GJE28112.1 hypothetical protein LKMONMHP_2978 [Methylobacterium organophilum]
MSFEVIFTQSAQELVEGRGDLPDLEERARDAIAELPGEGLEALERHLFHAFALDDGTEIICSLTGAGAVRVDACEAEAEAA